MRHGATPGKTYAITAFIALLHGFLNVAHGGGTVTTVVTGEIPERLSMRPTYRVLLPDDVVDAPPSDVSQDTTEIGSESIVRMVTAQGQAMNCRVPSAPAAATLPPRHLLGTSSYDDVEDILSGYRSQCFMRREGWWTFEFCYGEQVVQYHDPKTAGERADRFILGTLNQEYDAARRKLAADVPRPDAAYTQLYANGTTCDVTGRPRQVLVKYVCADDTAQMTGIAKHTGELFLVKAVREVASCVYELDFVSSAICKQKLYKSRARKTALDINCEMADPQEEFRGLAAHSQRKGKASLTL